MKTEKQKQERNQTLCELEDRRRRTEIAWTKLSGREQKLSRSQIRDRDELREQLTQLNGQIVNAIIDE
jgi:hypothetical protein